MSKQSDEEVRNSIIGLGEKSIRKSYYPQLQLKIKEIEELNKNLEKKVKERTAELTEQKELFETLFYDTSYALALIKDGRFIDCNDALLDILGYKDKEHFLNLEPHELSPEFQPDGEESKKKADKLIKQTLLEGSIQFEWLHKNINNQLIWVEVSLTKIHFHNETHIHVSWKDITDKKNLEIEVQQHQDELEESNEELQSMLYNLKLTQKKLVESEKMASLGHIISGISKEINTPIDISVTAITFLLHNLSETKKSYKNLSEDELKFFFSNSKALSKTVNQNLKKIAKLIRYFQQIEVQENEQTKRTFNLKEYVHGMLLGKEEYLNAYRIKVNFECKEDITINGHPEDYSQIISALISNTMHHAFKEIKKPEIHITIKKENSFIRIFFNDNGVGVPKEFLAKIFEPFFTLSEEEECYGLGLSIIFNIINNKLHGNITCKSQEGSGTAFTISIPDNQVTNPLTYHI